MIIRQVHKKVSTLQHLGLMVIISGGFVSPSKEQRSIGAAIYSQTFSKAHFLRYAKMFCTIGPSFKQMLAVPIIKKFKKEGKRGEEKAVLWDFFPSSPSRNVLNPVELV